MIRHIKNVAHLVQAFIANVIFRFPSSKMICIGVTGTDGKTTTASLIYTILRKANKKTCLITTVGAYIGDTMHDTGFHVTTPSAFSLQAYLKKAKDAGCTHAVIEVTSHALDQNRTFGIHFKIGVLSNITHEHLDYHKTYDRYVQAKSHLLLASDICVINREDVSYEKLSAILKGTKCISYGVSHSLADYTCESFQFETPLLGVFNQQNILASIVATKNLGISDNDIHNAIASYNPPIGRQEVIYKNDYTVIVDFAHTPHSFKQILPVVKSLSSNRLIHVFGTASERDETKRPFMGEESAKYADIIILTAEDPRKESVFEINKSILKGIPKMFERIDPEKYVCGSKNIVIQFARREEAITFAIKIAEKGDVIIATGKGHEQSMNYGNGEEPYDEKRILLNAINIRDTNYGKTS
ncbi:MAG: UDP-N-acetylmuramoyl-L-alanyl-D-glutamate--2,6-diaminopimelate ligase [Candidatus Roizmanbacteria bacterium]